MQFAAYTKPHFPIIRWANIEKKPRGTFFWALFNKPQQNMNHVSTDKGISDYYSLSKNIFSNARSKTFRCHLSKKKCLFDRTFFLPKKVALLMVQKQAKNDHKLENQSVLRRRIVKSSIFQGRKCSWIGWICNNLFRIRTKMHQKRCEIEWKGQKHKPENHPDTRVKNWNVVKVKDFCEFWNFLEFLKLSGMFKEPIKCESLLTNVLK